jgi:formylglycine-generating enzyme required for sulfatase activity
MTMGTRRNRQKCGKWCQPRVGCQDQLQADTSGDTRVLRGGSWYYFADVARGSRRDGYDPDARYDRYGFRLVWSDPIP